MNLTIKNSGGRKFPYYRIMNENEEFCATANHHYALLIIKALEEDEAVNLIIERQKLTLDEILENIFEKTKIDLRKQFSQQREFVNLRFIYCKIAIDNGFTLKATGKLINRNHDSVLNAVRKFNDYYRTEPEFRELYEMILK